MSTIDRVMAQALSGGQIDGELYLQRERYERPLEEAREALQRKCADVQALRAELDECTAQGGETSVDTEGLLAGAGVVLRGKAQALQRAQRAQEVYQLHHALTREPIQAQPVESLLFLGILVFIEAGINVSFFLNAHMAAGPFAALLLSLLISLTNVAVSTCAGYFIGRWKDYGASAADGDTPEFAKRRALSRILFVIYVVAIGLFHLTVGLVRSQESLDGVEHGISGYVALLTTPEALFLILIGACMSALAYYKGTRAFDDPYPGYGERHRAVLAIQDELLDLFEETAEQIEERFEEEEEDLDKGAATQKRAFDKYNKSVRACLDARRALEGEIASAESALRAQVAQLAAHHRTVRGQSTQSPEAIPDQLVSFEGFMDIEIPSFAHPPDEDDRRARLEQAKSAALNRLSELFQQAFEAEKRGDFQ